jgi:hypothetical protein
MYNIFPFFPILNVICEHFVYIRLSKSFSTLPDRFCPFFHSIYEKIQNKYLHCFVSFVFFFFVFLKISATKLNDTYFKI